MPEETVFLCLLEGHFSTNASLRLVETDFLASKNHFLFIFSRLLLLKAFFHLVETYFWTNSSFRILGKDFLSSGKRLLYLRVFFLIAEIVTDISGSQVFKNRTYSCWWKLIFWLVQNIFFHCLRYFSKSLSSQLVGTHF